MKYYSFNIFLFIYRISESCEGYSGADLKALVTKASEVCFSEGKEMEKAGKSKSKKVTKTHFAQALTAIRPSVSGKEKVRYEKTRLDLMPHHFHEKNTSSLPPAVIQKSIPNFINNGKSITTRESLLESVKESPSKSNSSESYQNPMKESQNPVKEFQNSEKESIPSSAKEALQTFKFQKIVTEPVKETVKEPMKEMVLPGIFSGKKFTYVKETSQESIEESIQESVEKCLQSTKKINSTDDSEHNKGTSLFFIKY